MAVLHTKGVTSMTNNQKNKQAPSAEDLLDAIRNKGTTPEVTMHDKLRKMLQNNGSVRVALPTGQTATITESKIDPLTDARSLENPISVRTALEIAFEKYEETDDDGPSIHEAIVSGKPIAVSDKNKELADNALKYFGHQLFEKKLKTPDELSDWENEIAKLVSTPDRPLKRMWTSLATTLPRFYNINVLKLKLMELRESTPEGMLLEFDTVQKIGDKEIPLVSKLRFIEKFVQRNSRSNRQVYVFSANYNNSYLIQYSIDRDDGDKIRMLDYILANNAKNGVYEVRLLAQSKRWAAGFNCLDVQAIEFI
jgi:hypothetical protein